MNTKNKSKVYVIYLDDSQYGLSEVARYDTEKKARARLAKLEKESPNHKFRLKSREIEGNV